MDFIIVHLEYRAHFDAGKLAWANSLLQTYSGRRAIVVSHSMVDKNNPAPFTPEGQPIYDALKANANLFAMLGGYAFGEGRRQDVFNGNTVTSMLSNYQNRPNGGDGWLRILEFSPADDVVRVSTYSPSLDAFETDDSSQFTFTYQMDGGPPGFTLVGSQMVPSGSSATTVWPGLAPATDYEWHVTISDAALTTTGPTWTLRTFRPGAPPDIRVAPNPHAFSDVLVGGSATQVFTLTNTGETDLTIGAASLTGGEAAQFAIEVGGAGVIPPGGTAPIEVRFTPVAPGLKTTTLRVPSDDPDENPVDVPLSGTGVQPPSTGTPVLVEVQSGGSSGLASVATTLDLTGATDHLYLAVIATRQDRPVTTVTGLGLGWTLVKAQCAARKQTRLEVWQALGSATTGLVTATLAAAAQHAVIVAARYSGVDPTAPVGATQSSNTNGLAGACPGSGTDTPAYAFDLPTSVANAVVFGAATMRGRAHTPGAGYSEQIEVIQGTGGGTTSIALMDQPVALPTTVLVDGTFSNPVDYAIVGLEIRPDQAAPSVAISAPTDGTSVVAGTALTFTGTATDNEDDDATLTAALAWTSDLDGAIGTGGTFATAMLTAGTHTIVASVTDSGGRAANASIRVTVTDSPRGDDVAVDFGGAFGVWGLFNNGPSASLQGAALASTPTALPSLDGVTSGQLYAQIHPASPEAMAAGDVDGSGRADLILDFPGAGVWIWLNNSAWVQLHPANVAAMATGDLDGNGQAEVILDFLAAGTWVRLNNSSWVQLHPARPTQMTTGDLDGNGQDEVILNFSGFGVWVWFNNTAWVPLHPADVTGMTVGDLDGSGQADVIIDFPGFGLWIWSNNATWSPFHPLSTSGFTTGDLDGNGLDEAIIDFPGFGLWVRYNNSVWVPLHRSSAETILTADIDGSGQADVIVDLGALGLWAWVNNAAWIELHALSRRGSPRGISTGSSVL